MKKISFKAFTQKCMNGESRYSKDAVSYVLIKDDGSEVFYGEWPLGDIETDADGEVTPAGWAEVERIDAIHLPKAYDAYCDGEAEYKASGWGGYRPGSGRKPVKEKRKPYAFRLTQAEHAKVKAFIKKMKEENKMTKEAE
jgi:hypothetical protein